MKKVFLTGASGFVGRHAVPYLLKTGYEVHALFQSTRPENIHDKHLFWHRGDLLQSKDQERLLKVIKPTHLLHLAWYTTPGKYWTSLLNLRWLQASLDLLLKFSENGGKRAVMAGTCAEYDWRYGYCSEGLTPLKPATLYGACKNSLCGLLEHLSGQSGLSYSWGRIFFVYGPYEYPNRLVSSVIRSLLMNQPARCSNGSQMRDFLHVEDVASAFVSLLESETLGPVNIASGHPIAVRDLVYTIAEKINKKDLIHLGQVSIPSNEPELLVADVSRLIKEVRWVPRYTIAEGLEMTIDWWRRNLFPSP